MRQEAECGRRLAFSKKIRIVGRRVGLIEFKPAVISRRVFDRIAAVFLCGGIFLLSHWGNPCYIGFR